VELIGVDSVGYTATLVVRWRKLHAEEVSMSYIIDAFERTTMVAIFILAGEHGSASRRPALDTGVSSAYRRIRGILGSSPHLRECVSMPIAAC
jgi:hypothetical protein